MPKIEDSFGGEQWRIITPILLTSLTILSTINIWVMNLIRDDVSKNSQNIEQFATKVHSMEIWKSAVEESRFRVQDSVRLKQEILDEIKRNYPPAALVEKVEVNTKRINGIESKVRR